MLASSSGISPLSGGEATRSVSPERPPRAPGLSLPGARCGRTPTDLALEEEDLRASAGGGPWCPGPGGLSIDRRAEDRLTRFDRRAGTCESAQAILAPGPETRSRLWRTWRPTSRAPSG